LDVSHPIYGAPPISVQARNTVTWPGNDGQVSYR